MEKIGTASMKIKTSTVRLPKLFIAIQLVDESVV